MHILIAINFMLNFLPLRATSTQTEVWVAYILYRLTFLCIGGRYHTSATKAQLVSRSNICCTIPILLLFQKASPNLLSYCKEAKSSEDLQTRLQCTLGGSL